MVGSLWCVHMHIWYIGSWWILKEWPSGLTFFYIFVFLSCCAGFVHSSFISSELKTLQSSRQRLSLALSFSHSLRPSVPRLQISVHEYQVTDVTSPNNYSKKGFHTLSTICEHMISLGLHVVPNTHQSHLYAVTEWTLKSGTWQPQTWCFLCMFWKEASVPTGKSVFLPWCLLLRGGRIKSFSQVLLKGKLVISHCPMSVLEAGVGMRSLFSTGSSIMSTCQVMGDVRNDILSIFYHIHWILAHFGSRI